MAQRRVQLTIRGRLEGAFFGASARREARGLRLSGFVSLRSDGAADAIVEGEEHRLKEFIAWANRGPTAARVDSVDVRWRSFKGDFSDFSVREPDDAD